MRREWSTQVTQNRCDRGKTCSQQASVLTLSVRLKLAEPFNFEIVWGKTDSGLAGVACLYNNNKDPVRRNCPPLGVTRVNFR